MTDNEMFEKLIFDNEKSPEEVYQIMVEHDKSLSSTQRILRSKYKYSDCIYEGTIGVNDFVMAETSSTSLDDRNIAMVYDDYHEMIIKFIEEFRKEFPSKFNVNLLYSLVIFSLHFVDDIFCGVSRSGKGIHDEREEISKLNDKRQLKEYDISKQRGKGRKAVCCERNTTIGNIFRFAGFETMHIAGVLYETLSDEIEADSHLFCLVKHGKGEGVYALVDAFNEVMVPNVLPGNYDFSNGFSIEYYDKKCNKKYTYELNGPLYEMTDEILEVEAIIRELGENIELLKKKYQNGLGNEEIRIERIRDSIENLLIVIQNSEMNELFKERYIGYIEKCFIPIIDKIQKSSVNTF